MEFGLEVGEWKAQSENKSLRKDELFQISETICMISVLVGDRSTQHPWNIFWNICGVTRGAGESVSRYLILVPESGTDGT